MKMIKSKIMESIDTKNKIIKNKKLLQNIKTASDTIIKTLKKGNKIMFCGNGGSAADAQHLAAEFMGKFYLERNPLPAISLTTNTSVLTAIGNDFSFDEIFLRQLKGIGKKGDVIIGISTSGNAENVLKAIKYAKENGIFIIGLTGETGGLMKGFCDILLNIPSDDTPRIQEAHITIGHIICEIVEKSLFLKKDT